MNKRKCVLGVLKSEEGLKIKEEMLSWLSPLYDVICVEQEAPGELFEYPAIKMACDISENTYQPVLYIHTKGAGNPRPQQAWLRTFWKGEFADHIDLYFDKVNTLSPTVAAPFVSKTNKICWYNGFVMNPAAAREINKNLVVKTDRMWYEQGMLTACQNIDCVGILSNHADVPEEGNDEFVKYIFRRIGLVSLIKDEAPYLREWLNHYISIGITDFFIFDNNELGDESHRLIIDEFDKKYKNIRFNLYDLRGREALEKAGFQIGIYNHITNELVKKRAIIRWMTYLDADEFIRLEAPYKTLQDMLWSDTFRGVDQVHLNWRCIGDNGHILYEDKPVQERFTIPCDKNVVYNDTLNWTENQHVKYIVRLNSIPKYCQAHTASMKEQICLNALGEEVNGNKQISDKIVHEVAWIDHYCCKSLEEYINKKCKYQFNIANSDIIDSIQRLKWYFNMNKKTEEKLKFIKDKLNIDL